MANTNTSAVRPTARQSIVVKTANGFQVSSQAMWTLLEGDYSAAKSVCVTACEGWLRRKGRAESEAVSLSQTVSGEQDGIRFAIRAEQESWKARLETVDPEKDRRWGTEVSVRSVGAEVQVAFRSSWLGHPTKPPLPGLPAILAQLVEGLPLSDGGSYRLTATPSHVDSSEKFENFLEHLTAPHREFPVIVMTPGRHEEWQPAPGYVLNPVDFARTVAGMAHVVCLDDSFTRELKAELGDSFSVYNGAIRFFEPGFSPTDEYLLHRRVVPLTEAQRGEKRALDALRWLLVDHLLTGTLKSLRVNRCVNAHFD